MAIAANTVPGIRAAAITDAQGARLAREHNDLNVLTLGARSMTLDEASVIVRIFLQPDFHGGRHNGRVQKIHEIEKR